MSINSNLLAKIPVWQGSSGKNRLNSHSNPRPPHPRAASFWRLCRTRAPMLRLSPHASGERRASDKALTSTAHNRQPTGLFPVAVMRVASRRNKFWTQELHACSVLSAVGFQPWRSDTSRYGLKPAISVLARHGCASVFSSPWVALPLRCQHKIALLATHSWSITWVQSG